MTTIRRITKKVYYKLASGRVKNTYRITRHKLEFPARFPVSDLVGKELEFERVDEEIRIRLKKIS